MPGQTPLDLGWVNVDPSGDNQFGRPSGQEQIAVLVEVADIAHREEAVSGAVPRLLRCVVIFKLEARHLDVHLTGLVRGTFRAVLVVDPDSRAGPGQSDRSRTFPPPLGTAAAAPASRRAVILVDDRPKPVDHPHFD